MTATASSQAAGPGAAATNIKVIVRCRPLSAAETRGRNAVVVTTSAAQRQVTVASEIRGSDTKKTYTFDSVFGEASTQEALFGDIHAIVDEVLEGFNCTVFAYGQTGTGKTYTMQGPEMNADITAECGIIPRAIHAIFDRLRCKDVNECVVHVSCLEIYNEEICDLLSEAGEVDLRIFEDSVKGVFVSNLEEVLVVDPNDIFKVLTRSWDRRRTAETKMNANSSRSHTIFTVKVHTKETTVDGEEIIKVGKLNLVDLAGSECIGKSEAVGVRAKEAGQINRSLLTLGRVINALVQGNRHIPYRESKLTRLLQESLGGRTKTILIATISPSQKSVEETLSTLEYAHTAKNILNRPEVNQKVTQKAYVRDLQVNLNALRRQLEAQRAKTGVFLPGDQFKAMEEEISQSREDRVRLDSQIDEYKANQTALSNELTATRQKLSSEQTAHAHTSARWRSESEQWAKDRANFESEIASLTTQCSELTAQVMRRDEALQRDEAARGMLLRHTSERVHDLRTSLDQLLALHTGQAADSLERTSNVCAEVRKSINGVVAEAKKSASEVSQSLQATSQLLAATVQTAVADDLSHIRDKVAESVQTVSGMVDSIVGICASQLQSVSSTVANHGARISELSATWNNTVSSVQAQLDGTSSLLFQAIDDIQASVSGVESKVVGSLSALSDEMNASHDAETSRTEASTSALLEEITAIVGRYVAQQHDARHGAKSRADKLITATLESSSCTATIEQVDGLRASLAESRAVEKNAWTSASTDLSNSFARQSGEALQALMTVSSTGLEAVQQPAKAALAAVRDAHALEIAARCDRLSATSQTLAEGVAGRHAQVTGQCRASVEAVVLSAEQVTTACDKLVRDGTAVRDANETGALRYRDEHHHALAAVDTAMHQYREGAGYASPVRAANAQKATAAASRTVKRPREISVERDGIENKRPNQETS
ncbi:Kinesin-like protein [Plasmodiophora brassicae]|uniref:Kinesin-like protein n=1 Tax=Plasmodiophora brassicae TaxID=37360 RepID=A0A3P3YN12_PLABS|nr:unnamed protein product [Plasmodiophora brassicae]